MTSNLQDTIAALATPTGESGIAVVRLSGPSSLDILSDIFVSAAARREPSYWKHRRTYHGHITAGQETVDEVVCAVTRQPDTYTGEDTVEVTCHGNTLIVKRVLDLMFAAGARAAEPGEFTKRAFLNGKIDLIQAEAVADLIHARSELQRQVAQEQLAGGLSARVNALAGELLDLLGVIEANIDFIEDDIDTLDVEGSLQTLARHAKALDELLNGAAIARPFHEGYRVAITGRVNVGKSSLFNRLVGESRAIVTEVPGTTRDVLREPIVLEGLLFVVQDTAGLRDTDHQVERIGVDRAVSTREEADIVLHVVDATEPDTPTPSLPAGRAVIVLNKCDLAARTRGVSSTKDAPVIQTSAVTGEGLDTLRKCLVECVGRDRLEWIARERVVLNTRLVSVLRDARKKIDILAKNLRGRTPLEILALDAREALQCYEAATGRRYSDGLLDAIFSRFCIGK